MLRRLFDLLFAAAPLEAGPYGLAPYPLLQHEWDEMCAERDAPAHEAQIIYLWPQDRERLAA